MGGASLPQAIKYTAVHDFERFEAACNQAELTRKVLMNCLAPCIRATDLDALKCYFWHWRAHVECLMRAGVVVLSEPMVDENLGPLGRHEPLRIEDLTT